MITEESTIFKSGFEVLFVASGHLPAVTALLQISEKLRAFKAFSVTDPDT
ncbi:hypothetical protein [Pseudomonas putida]|uniref:Uncharacterized protein n=1 Tax=Pseudomonas putida TaxID=303 RepID=A0AAW4BY11_PSEPU|nr:hypothetical protein [Pseudomonas putida]MBF8703048.1 hypothetical protein [Pseudomonas putida]MBF8736904.1 hypothetical protein [Pseudomonas putida]